MALPWRENSHLPTAGWSIWRRAMVPSQSASYNLEPRGPSQVGFICSSIRSAFPDQAEHCGIYEWQARGVLHRQPNHVVYIGSTCSRKPGLLRGRILEYCTNGSHKVDLINDALRRGYELWVRVKSTQDRETAEDLENELLDHYNYAWNVRCNGGLRRILPCLDMRCN